MALRPWLALLALAGGLAACAPAPPVRQESYVFGTRVEVLIHGEPEGRAREAGAAVLQEFDRLHRMLHPWQPSELTALNGAIACGADDIEVSAELARVIADARTLALRSDHLFNPAIGALVKLWGFHGDNFEARLPDEGERLRLLASEPRIGDLAVEGRHLRSRNPAVALDLGGYAKGYALDRAAHILRQRGVRNALVNIGGNVIALGSKGGTPWRVGIQHPRQTTPLATLELRDGEAIGTSGDYQRYFELDGQRYCHLIDPRSGAPARGTQAVTVLIPPGEQAGTLSDVLSKPLFVAGRERWAEYARRLGVANALRVDGGGRVELTAAMKERIHLEKGSGPVVVVE
ncbi:MAG: FAD:protein FMN transferase [Betaproteobacteria bacterium]|nr:FAD:protein FMN transferase [Betaproteobacteria bacterium]